MKKENTDRIPIKKFVVGIVLSPVIIGVFWIIVTLLLSFGKASGAIVITSLTDEEAYTAIKSTSGTTVSWTAIFNAGGNGSSESNSEAVLKTITQTVEGQYSWNGGNENIDDTFSVTYDFSGNLTSTPGSGLSISVQPTVGFNTILVRIGDSGTDLGTSVGGSINGSLISTETTFSDYRYVRIDLGEDSPDFNLIGIFKSSTPAVYDDVQIQFEGINFEGTAPNIPEPSVSLLALIGMMIAVFIRRR